MFFFLEICNQDKDVGPCRGAYNRFYYEPSSKRCVPFIYGGCRGNQNNFLSLAECVQMCKRGRAQPELKPNATEMPNGIVNCVLSDWSEWSECSVSCGLGFTQRSRRILVQPRNGGAACSKKLSKRQRCHRETC